MLPLSPAAADSPAAALTSAYTALPPTRVLDTRIGLGAPTGRPAPGATVRVPVAGVQGIPATGVTAVTVNLTLTDSAGPGYVQALPTGASAFGASSNVNTTGPGQTSANLATVPVGADGSITLYDVAGANLIADVQGYYSAAATAAAGRYQPLNPVRVLDSRDRTGMTKLSATPANPGDVKNCTDFATWADANAWFWTYYPYYGDVARLDQNNDQIPCESLPGNPHHVVQIAPPPFNPDPQPAAGEVIPLQLAGVGGVPGGGASSVVLTLTATRSAGPGFVQVVPTDGGTALGTTSNVNLTGAGQTVANLVVVPLGTGGTVDVYNSSGTDVIADVLGYYTDGTAATSSAGLFVPVNPFRLTDTRATAPVAANSQTALSTLGIGGVPGTGVGALALNVTATGTTGPGYLQILPTDQGTPGASSSVNFTGAGQTAASAAIGNLGTQGRFTVYASTRTNVIVDVSGYFTAGTTTPPSGITAELQQLTVAPTYTGGGYDRSAWGDWTTHNCQDTRAQVLIAESSSPVTLSADGCTVTGGNWLDPYSGLAFTSASDLQIDHVVPVKNAYDSGAWQWDAARMSAYYNDVADAGQLLAVKISENEAKGDSGPEAWKPPLVSDYCAYATDWVQIKARWSLTVTPAEHDALASMLATCPAQ
jgi:hypothetical protein